MILKTDKTIIGHEREYYELSGEFTGFLENRKGYGIDMIFKDTNGDEIRIVLNEQQMKAIFRILHLELEVFHLLKIKELDNSSD